ncbi:MAG: hypothetical protein KAI17_14040, partial [Thiotrichaceae bacterium]|nr:hypothetical protein [Thiotrichaceae bacterium]
MVNKQMIDLDKVNNQENNSKLAFFFVFLYVVLTFIRPHEIFIATEKMPIVFYITILSLLTTVFAQKPLYTPTQLWMIILLWPFIMISAYLNGSGMMGFEHSETVIISALIPLFIISACTTSIKRHEILMWVSIIASVLMIHNGYTQFNSYDG